MMSNAITVGIVVRDPFGRLGIVCGKEPAPPADWIAEQVMASRIQEILDPEWFGVMVFGGGFVLWPGEMLEYQRPR